jgi:hypothetical protein
MNLIKKTAILSALSFSVITQADTVKIINQAQFKSPQGILNSSASFPFVGTQTISFEVAGKICKLNGSARGSVPMGCNYEINVNPEGVISGRLTAGNSVCTQSSGISKACS